MLATLAASSLVACGKHDETRTLDPAQLAMTSKMTPWYDDGELTLYTAKLPYALPIRGPTQLERDALNQEAVDPFPRTPWLTSDEVRVQITWTISNLDGADHAVELLVDPWNEFGKYWPGLALTDPQDAEFTPNLSGIDALYELPGLDSGRETRIHGTLTYEDLGELARDFAAAINIIDKVPPPDPDAGYDAIGPVTLVNHAFASRSPDALTDRYVPAAVPGLVGLDVGLQTREPANIALEFVVEVVDVGQFGRVAPEGTADKDLLREPTRYYTVGFMGP